MKYTLYPGCASEGTAISYHHSALEVAKVLGLELKEIEDWNCCGATVTSSVIGQFAADVLAARNLALAEKMGQEDVVATCSSCYAILGNVNKKFSDEKFKVNANDALSKDGLSYDGKLKVRMLLDVMVSEVGLDTIASKVVKPLKGLKVAGYVGCQTVRALREFDNWENPTFLDEIIAALGAEPVPFSHKLKCCTGAMAISSADITVSALYPILKSAHEAGADLIVTPCPLCQMNLDAFQVKVNKGYGTNYNLPVLFFTQLMAVAYGLDSKKAGLDYCIVSPNNALKQFGV
ncbi:heterodisulfide reductase subunit B [Desulforamulus putei DSM 12395]|uniref:Heterodisulfide reductase subunit B n=1 Tax=Desulforamulus putei DSM 12395 TaxID=1121429 RepID=A0A1M4XCC5_9FIRM|nr:CoB--CoM heterodisulfide reductase iron-sulfur subunit B family protein [Desulforamulus putei]SHE91070.1 heterodisulfide reductase subunit B [Desulforamulus putei DSM 12395]